VCSGLDGALIGLHRLSAPISASAEIFVPPARPLLPRQKFNAAVIFAGDITLS
jgi:hypothetical protein